jgi:hypothetical protein
MPGSLLLHSHKHFNWGEGGKAVNEDFVKVLLFHALEINLEVIY